MRWIPRLSHRLGWTYTASGIFVFLVRMDRIPYLIEYSFERGNLFHSLFWENKKRLSFDRSSLIIPKCTLCHGLIMLVIRGRVDGLLIRTYVLESTQLKSSTIIPHWFYYVLQRSRRPIKKTKKKPLTHFKGFPCVWRPSSTMRRGESW